MTIIVYKTGQKHANAPQEIMTYWINGTDGSVVTDGLDVTDGPDSTDGADGTDNTDGTDDSTDRTDGTDGIDDGLMGQLKVNRLIRPDRADWTEQADAF